MFKLSVPNHFGHVTDSNIVLDTGFCRHDDRRRNGGGLYGTPLLWATATVITELGEVEDVDIVFWKLCALRAG